MGSARVVGFEAVVSVGEQGLRAKKDGKRASLPLLLAPSVGGSARVRAQGLFEWLEGPPQAATLPCEVGGNSGITVSFRLPDALVIAIKALESWDSSGGRAERSF